MIGPRRVWILALVALLVCVVGLGVVAGRRRFVDRSTVHEGEELLREGHSDEAEAKWRGLVRADPANAAAWDRLASLYFGRNNPADAVEPLRNVLRLRPETPGIHRKLAECLLQVGDKSAALTQAREALKENPYDATSLVVAASLLDEMSQGAEALAYKRRLAQVRPNDSEALRTLAVALIGVGSYAEALPTIERLISVEPSKAPAYALRGIATFYTDRSVQGLTKAKADFEKSLQLEPGVYPIADRVPSFFYLGRVLARLHQPTKAIPLLEKAKLLQPGWGEPDFILAEAYDMAGQHDRAEGARQSFKSWRQEADQERVLALRVEINPSDFDSGLALAKIKLHKLDYDSAARYLSMALRLKPGDPVARTTMEQLDTLRKNSVSSVLGGGQ